jgi:tripartite-type tricarboxylate transporter receptor subunit TctC
MIEAGVPDFEISSWFGVTAPRGTPQPIIDRLGTILREILRNSAMIENLTILSAEPLPIIGSDFANFMAGQRERFGGIIRRLGITAAD